MVLFYFICIVLCCVCEYDACAWWCVWYVYVIYIYICVCVCVYVYVCMYVLCEVCVRGVVCVCVCFIYCMFVFCVMCSVCVVHMCIVQRVLCVYMVRIHMCVFVYGVCVACVCCMCCI